MKYIMLLLFVPIVAFGQIGIAEQLFKDVANDTIASISVPDSVYARWTTGGPWKQLTQTQNDTAWVTVDDKSAENDLIFILPDESFWTYGHSLQFKIQATGTDTITSRWVNISGLRGALTLVIRPDTSGTNTDYSKSYLMGN